MNRDLETITYEQFVGDHTEKSHPVNQSHALLPPDSCTLRFFEILGGGIIIAVCFLGCVLLFVVSGIFASALWLYRAPSRLERWTDGPGPAFVDLVLNWFIKIALIVITLGFIAVCANAIILNIAEGMAN